MTILTLLGSARPKSNTATILGWVEDELKSQGHTVERINVTRKTIGGCIGCAKCREKAEEIGCIQNDDAIEIMEKMIAADCVLFASPVYFWGFTAQLKALIDRTYSLVVNYHTPNHASLMEGKNIALLATGGGQFENNADGMFTAFDRLSGYLLTKKAAELFVGGCSTPDALPDGTQERAIELACGLCL
ncbi:flavodoxin family protein [Desulfovibrio inopinatus]|uniref:flavodoxin family protein n=1 Tax=Desulfovibrio inopinatus TaxID=102109 RepID=UPI0003FA50BC|nr:flavodoxin family protein [Desulfovibrio inopinatus]